MRRRVKKVFRIKHAERGVLLVAFAGNGAYCLRVLDWLKGGEQPKPTDFHTAETISYQCAVVIDEQRRVGSLGNDLFWQEMLESIYANGAGQEFAWGALEAGATAVQAIKIAMKRSDYAGLGIDSVSFSGR